MSKLNVNLTFRPSGDWIQSAHQSIQSQTEFGLDLTAYNTQAIYDLITYLNKHEGFLPHYIILSSHLNRTTLSKLIKIYKTNNQQLSIHAHLSILNQLTDISSQFSSVPLIFSKSDVDELDRISFSGQSVVRGYECSGLCGLEPQYILLQYILSKTHTYNVSLSGPFGIRSFHSFTSFGINTIYLEEQILLLDDSPLSTYQKNSLMQLSGRTSDVLVIKSLSYAKCRLLPDITNQQSVANTPYHDEIKDKSLLNASLSGYTTNLLPLSEGLDFAKDYHVKYKRIGRLIRAYLKEPLPINHTTNNEINSIESIYSCEYPIIQGPMSRVSDNPEFAEAVSFNGAIPTIAASTLSPSVLNEILNQTTQKLIDKKWAVGLLGFIDQELLNQQINVVRNSSASICILAGGTPSQAKNLSDNGLETFIHAPTPELMSLFIDQGWKSFVIEGRECGGHIGPISSLTLWERCLSIISIMSKHKSQQIKILFAGGIHDELSAKILRGLIDSFPIENFHPIFGLLVGSAYLSTEEIVDLGSITNLYQEVTINSTVTTYLETSKGHQTRCALTPFAENFNITRQQLHESGRAKLDVREELENLILGRLRLASKGLKYFNNSLQLSNKEEQYDQGLFMLGEVVTLIDKSQSLKLLHKSISAGFHSSNRFTKPTLFSQPNLLDINSTNDDIAIIGMSVIFPNADTLEEYWNNILLGKNSITQVPPTRWDTISYSTSTREPFKINSKWGSFLQPVTFNPIDFGIPPKLLPSIDSAQILSLIASNRALQDAGYGINTSFDRSNTSVFFGFSGGLGELGQGYLGSSIMAPLLSKYPKLAEHFPTWTSDSFPGLLPNVISGRIANRFNLGGTNCTLDAACASSFAAVDLAVSKLRSNTTNMAIVGGVDTLQSPFPYFCFSETGALSQSGSVLPFTNSADGIVLGEGVGVVILKRLEDAIFDGDRIYSVISGIGSSSDGRARSMTAPSYQGQIRSFSNAYQDARIEPSLLGYYEAHGTGTPVGDRSEVIALNTFLEQTKNNKTPCYIGSVKSLIGHTKSAAGIAGLIKASLAIYTRTIPSHLYQHPLSLDPINEIKTSQYLKLSNYNLPWLLQNTHTHPQRVAGVSAFGFGGTNYHIVLKENLPDQILKNDRFSFTNRTYCSYLSTTPLTKDNTLPYLITITGNNRKELSDKLSSILKLVNSDQKLPNKQLSTTTTNDIITSFSSCKCHSSITGQHFKSEISVVCTNSIESLINSLAIVETLISDEQDESDILSRRVWRSLPDTISPNPPKINLVLSFPGQSSQYPGFALKLISKSSDFNNYLAQIFTQIDLLTEQQALEDYLFNPRSTYLPSDLPLLPAVIVAYQCAWISILQEMGFEWTTSIGHSLGDYSSLVAANVITASDAISLVISRCFLLNTLNKELYNMVHVHAAASQIESLINSNQLQEIYISNINGPSQTVVSGIKSQIEQLIKLTSASNIDSTLLNINIPYHTPLLQSLSKQYLDCLQKITFNQPKYHISLSTAPDVTLTTNNVHNLLIKHLTNPVRFIEFVQSNNNRLDDLCFCDIGPKKVVSNMVKSILSSPNNILNIDGPILFEDLLLSCSFLTTKTFKINWKYIISHFVPYSQAEFNETAQETDPKNIYYVDGANAYQSGHKPTNHIFNLDKTLSTTITDMNDQTSPHPLNSTLTNVGSEINKVYNGFKNKSFNNKPMSSHNKSNDENSYQYTDSPSQSEKLQAYLEFQQTMRSLIESQTRVLSAYLTSPSEENSAPTSSSSASSTLPTSTTKISNSDKISLPTVSNSSQLSKGNTFSYQTDHQNEYITELTVDNIINDLTLILTDKTGYPVDLLDPGADLEADLGIDSIKKVEVLGSYLTNKLSLDSDQLQAITTQSRELQTLIQVADLIYEIINNPPNVEKNNISNSQQPTTINQYDNDKLLENSHAELNASTLSDHLKSTRSILPLTAPSILTDLTLLLSELSGYPPDLLEPDMDLESDLGIDSIKKVEVLGKYLSTLTLSSDLLLEIQQKLQSARTLSQSSQIIFTFISSSSPDLQASNSGK